MRTTAKGLNISFSQAVPTGTVNGSNVTFTLPFTPYADAAMLVFLDGRPQILTTDWSRSGTTLTMVVAPAAGQQLYVWFLRLS